MLWNEKILRFFKGLEITATLPKEVVVMNPYPDKEVFKLCEKFYGQYYADSFSRSLIIGINPGRFGAGLTGIPFTDPLKLEQVCAIPNYLKKKAELSSDFIYQLIDALGGTNPFYSRFYFSSVSPLGFTKNGKNLNYYDVPELQSAIIPFIKDCLHKQLKFGLNTDVCFVLGEGKNFTFMETLNLELKLFRKLIPLPHPRFIMQYKRKSLKKYLQLYKSALSI